MTTLKLRLTAAHKAALEAHAAGSAMPVGAFVAALVDALGPPPELAPGALQAARNAARSEAQTGVTRGPRGCRWK